jgi:hypothetical protein
MKIFVAFCCFIAAASAVPQPQCKQVIQKTITDFIFKHISAFRERIRNQLLNSAQNPCGAGVKPTSCTCPDGTTFTPGQK